MLYSKLLSLIFLFSFLSAEITLSDRDSVIINSNTPTDLKYGYYFDKFQAQTIKLFDSLDVSNYKDKYLYVGYGVYDKQNNFCKYIDVDYNKDNFKSYFTTIQTINNKTYAISLKKYSLKDAKTLVARFNGYIVAPNSVFINSTLNTIYKDKDYWIGLFRDNCDEDLKNPQGITPQYINLAFSENICDNNRLSIYKNSNSLLWYYDNPENKHYVVIEIDSPDYKRPIKVCAPWWRIERTYKKDIDNENLEVKRSLSILKYQYPPKATRLCVEYNKNSISNERYITQCKTYYDRTADPICSEDMFNPICQVNTCKGYIENNCELVEKFSPLKDYSYSYVQDSNTGQTKRIKIIDKIVDYIYDCPPIPPSANNCLKSQKVLIYPTECPNSQCSSFIDCIKEGNSEEQCKEIYKCEVQYGSVDSQNIDENGKVIGLYGKCSDGTIVEAKVASLTQKEVKCLKYEKITETNTTIKICEAQAKEEKHSVSADITEKDIYQTDPNCIRLNNIVDARPDEEINLLVTQPGNMKTLVTYQYIDNYSDINNSDENISNIYYNDNSLVTNNYINNGIKEIENSREISTNIEYTPGLLSEEWFNYKTDPFIKDIESDTLDENIIGILKRKDDKVVKQCKNINDVLIFNKGCYRLKDLSNYVPNAKIYEDTNNNYSFITTFYDKNYLQNVCYDSQDTGTQYIQNENICIGSYLCGDEKCGDDSIIDGTCPYKDLTPFNVNTGMCESSDSAITFDKWVAYGEGNWSVSNDGTYVKQLINGKPTEFVSDFSINGKFTISGVMNVENDGDNDWIGLVFNFKDSDNYYLIDWDKSYQDNFHEYVGWRLIKVENGKRTILKQVDSSGWEYDTDYNIKVIIDNEKTRIFVNDNEILSYEGDLTSSEDGKVGFYNYSQSKVTYKDFKLKTLPNCPDGYNLAPNGQCVIGDLSCVSDNYIFNVKTQRCEANITKCDDGFTPDEKGFCKDSNQTLEDINKYEYLYIFNSEPNSNLVDSLDLVKISDDKKQEYLINYPFNYLETKQIDLGNIANYQLYASDKLIYPNQFAVIENKGDYLTLKTKDINLSNKCEDYAKDLDDANWTINEEEGCIIEYGIDNNKINEVNNSQYVISTLDGDLIRVKTNGYNSIFAIQNYIQDKDNIREWFSTYTMPPLVSSKIIDGDTNSIIMPISQYPYVLDKLTYSATLMQKTIRTKTTPPTIPEYMYQKDVWSSIFDEITNSGSFDADNFIDNTIELATGVVYNINDELEKISPILTLPGLVTNAIIRTTLAPISYVINFFRKSAKFADYKIEWEIYKNIDSIYKNKYLPYKRDIQNIDGKYKIVYTKQIYETGLSKSSDINEKITKYYNYKDFSLTLLGVDKSVIDSFKDSFEDKIQIGWKTCKWWQSCNNKTNTSEKTKTITFNKKITTAWSNSVNNLTIYVPYLGDYTIKAYDKYNNLLATKTIYAKNFISSGTKYSYQRVQLATADNFNIDYSIKNGNTTNACRFSTEVEWGGGVSGANYEINTPEGYHCQKSNDSYVIEHSATIIKIKPVNFTHWFNINLVKPMPFANRIIVITPGNLENREYKCYQENNCSVQ